MPLQMCQQQEAHQPTRTRAADACNMVPSGISEAV